MNWPDVFKGIQLCIGFQLFLIALFLFTSKQARNHLLGFYTVLICVSSLSSALYPFLEKVPMIAFLFGAQLIIFHAPLLFLYIKSLDHKTFSLNHFIFPSLYTVFLLFLKLNFTAFFDANNTEILMAHLFISLIFTSIYFIYGLNYFRFELQDALKQKALKKFRIFYTLTNIHAICLFLIMGCSYLSYLYFYDLFPYFNSTIVPQVFNTIVYIHPITSIIFITYLLSETHSLHSLVLQKGIFKSALVRKNAAQIFNEISRIIDVEKRFKNPEFNIKELSKIIGISTKELSEFFNEEMSISFNTYINQKKIEEFKSLLIHDSEETYSLEGMALNAGFNSKATFYRIFKKLEGVTPTQYRDSIRKVS